MTKKNIYIAMYRALDCLYDECHDEVLAEFLGEANPYLFIDRQSADPAIQADFGGFVNNDMDSIKAYNQVKEYLNNKTEFGRLFADISLEEWEDLCIIVESEEASNDGQ